MNKHLNEPMNPRFNPRKFLLTRGVFFSCVIFLNPAFAEEKFPRQSSSEISHVQSRLSQIFYWQIADELKLTPTVEKKLIEILEVLQKQRLELLESKRALFTSSRSIMTSASSAMKDLPQMEAEKFLENYEKIQTQIFNLEVEERLKLKLILSPSQLARFYLRRDELSMRIREALQRPQGKK